MIKKIFSLAKHNKKTCATLMLLGAAAFPSCKYVEMEQSPSSNESLSQPAAVQTKSEAVPASPPANVQSSQDISEQDFADDPSQGISKTSSLKTVLFNFVGGSKVISQPGIFGTKGMPSLQNIPSSRAGMMGAADKNGVFWIFGGVGYDVTGSYGILGDLWKFDSVSENWTWVSGGNTRTQIGVYGTQGVPNTTNVPGSRDEYVSFVDKDCCHFCCLFCLFIKFICLCGCGKTQNLYDS